MPALVAALILPLLAPDTRAHGCHHTDHRHDARTLGVFDPPPELLARHPGLADWYANLPPDAGSGTDPWTDPWTGAGPAAGGGPAGAGGGTGAAGTGLLDPWIPHEHPPWEIADPSCPTDIVTAPAGWFDGDTHEHIQICGNPLPPTLTPTDIKNDMIALGLDTSAILVWGGGLSGPAEYVNSFLPLVTGVPDPASTSTELLQFGLEVSGFDGSRMGHQIALSIDNPQADIFSLGLGCPPLWNPSDPPPFDWSAWWTQFLAGQVPAPDPGYKNDGSGHFAGPLFEHFATKPEAVRGYAHQRWPTQLTAAVCDGGWDWEDPSLPAWIGADAVVLNGQPVVVPDNVDGNNIVHPVMVHVDVALGRCDFLEAFDLDHIAEYKLIKSGCPDPVANPVTTRWYGAYYKLLSAGQRVSVTGGTDTTCASGGCDPRTYVDVGPGPLAFDDWTAGIRAGRVSLASQGHHVLVATIDAAGQTWRVGDQIDLDGSAGTPTVTVDVDYHIEATGPLAVQDEIQVVIDGQVVHSHPYGLNLVAGSNVESFSVQLPVAESSWLAVRTGHDTSDPGLGTHNPGGTTHTGAFYLIVDRKPIVDAAVDEYWMLYTDWIDHVISLWEQYASIVGYQEPLEYFIGCPQDIADARLDMATARAVFAAMRDYDLGDPPNVVRMGRASYGEPVPPPGILAHEDPLAPSGNTIPVSCFNGPRGGAGWLVVGGGVNLSTPALVGGAEYFITGNPFLVAPVTADAAGFATVQLPVPNPPFANPTPLYVQWLWFDATSANPWRASEVLELMVQ